MLCDVWGDGSPRRIRLAPQSLLRGPLPAVSRRAPIPVRGAAPRHAALIPMDGLCRPAGGRVLWRRGGRRPGVEEQLPAQMACHPPDEGGRLRDLRPERPRQRGHLTVQTGVRPDGDHLGRPVRCRLPSYALHGLGARAAARPAPAAPRWLMDSGLPSPRGERGPGVRTSRASLLANELEGNRLLAPHRALDDAPSGGDALVADLEGDERAEHDAAHASQHNALNEKSVTQRRHRRHPSRASLQVHDSWSLAPEPFQSVELTLHRSEDMHDDVTVVQQHPTALGIPFASPRVDVKLAHLIVYRRGDSLNLPAVGACADDEVIGENRQLADVDHGDVGGLLIGGDIYDGLGDINRLQCASLPRCSVAFYGVRRSRASLGAASAFHMQYSMSERCAAARAVPAASRFSTERAAGRRGHVDEHACRMYPCRSAKGPSRDGRRADLVVQNHEARALAGDATIGPPTIPLAFALTSSGPLSRS